MQSGTTGINTLRMYSPTKQAKDHDPEGIFIRQWCPELARVPLHHLMEPWKMPALAQQEASCVIGHDYPAPLVDEKAAIQFAKDQLYGMRKAPGAKDEAKAIQDKHGSRKGGLPPHRARAPRSPGKVRARGTPDSQPVQTAAPSTTNPQGSLF